MAKDTRWDRNLSVTPDAEGLIGHAGAVLLRKLADQCGLTSALGAALARTGKFPLIDRGMTLVSMAVAIALGDRGWIASAWTGLPERLRCPSLST
jgi:hypothetical protein